MISNCMVYFFKLDLLEIWNNTKTFILIRRTSMHWVTFDLERAEAVPEHPQAGVSLESWTSSRCLSLQEWRLCPREPGYRVWSPWTGQSGRSGCWETGPLQKRRKKNFNIWKSINTIFNCHVERGAPTTRSFSLKWNVLVYTSYIHSCSRAASIVLLFRIIPLLDKRGIIRLKPLQRHINSHSSHRVIHFLWRES